jgi:hypothetical protein
MGFWTKTSVGGEERPQIEHPDRVEWYRALIEEWTTQLPHIAVIDEQTVAAWIGPYSSVVGVRHYGSTRVWASSMEEALEGLCNWIYEDVQADLRSVCPGAMAGEVHMEEGESWMVNLR